MNQSRKLYCQFFGSCCLLIFVFLGYCIKFYSNSPFIVNIDNFFINAIRYPITSFKTFLFTQITNLGNPETITILALICGIFLLARKQYLEIIYLIINVLVIAVGTNQLLKLVFARPRPNTNFHLVHANGYSFPSGHSMGSVLFYGTLALLALYYTKNHKLWHNLSYLLFILPFLIGCSRIYLGVHYPTDVIGGWLFGIGWLCLSYPIYRNKRFVKDFQGR